MISRDYFEELNKKIFQARKPSEHFILWLHAEDSQFLRISQAKVRQIGTVRDASLDLTLLVESTQGIRKVSRSTSLCGDAGRDLDSLMAGLHQLRLEAAQLPVDPFAALPAGNAESSVQIAVPAIDCSQAVDAILCPEARELDCVGFYASGSIIRGLATSSGQRHWYSAPSFFLDYSLYTREQKACKRILAGRTWDQAKYERGLAEASVELKALEAPARKLERGDHRVYLAPDAVADLVQMFSWRCVGEASLRQGDSPLKWLRDGSRSLSPKFTLWEDFRGGECPRFTPEGEVAPEALCLIEKGMLKNTLVSGPSAKEYGVSSNGAAAQEHMRSPVLEGGDLDSARAIDALGTGIYVSNVHYLNWSNHPEGSVTGMTRHACFWVENGRRVSPIENLRWDDNLFRLFGSELEALTSTRELIPDTRTYEYRELGGTKVPGALIRKMRFTL